MESRGGQLKSSIAKFAKPGRRAPHLLRFLLALVAFAASHTLAQTRPLNDTGIDFCGASTSGNNKPCLGTEPAGQDAHYGRDKDAGGKGFDFTALDASGQPTTPSSGANPHPCVRDNVTGLIWEVKANDGGLHDQDWTYTWYDSVHNYYGNPGTASGGTCHQGGRCDTEKFVQDVNGAGWCGYSDWRMPTAKELEGIADFGRIAPAIDPTYFPNTPSAYFWSSLPFPRDSSQAWLVYFYNGDAGTHRRSSTDRVRLVRDGL